MSHATVNPRNRLGAGARSQLSRGLVLAVVLAMLAATLVSPPASQAEPTSPPPALTTPDPTTGDPTTGDPTTGDHRAKTKVKRAKLITVLDDATGLLGEAPHPGVHRVAFATPPLTKITATLNGKRVLVPAPSARHVRALLVSRTDGVRRGANTLRVSATAADGTTDVLVRKFRIRSDTPLAAAGVDRSLTTGHRASLNAANSVPGKRGHRLTYRWRVVSAPSWTAQASLKGSTSAKASLVLKKPGRYVLAVQVSERSRRGRVQRSTDLVTVAAALATPAIGARIDTMADGPNGGDGPGLLVDATFSGGGKSQGTKAWYRGPKPGGAQVYALDRTSLRPSAGFDGTIDPTDPDGSLGRILADVPPGTMVVIVGADGCCAQSDGQLLPKSGPFSHIFNYDGAGTKNVAEAGTWNKNRQLGIAPAEPGRAGALTGYLRLAEGGTNAESDGLDAFRFVQGDRAAYASNVADEPLLGPADGATYRLNAVGHGALQPTSDDVNSFSRITTGGLTSSLGQQWQLRRTYGQYFQIVNARSGLCLNWSGSDSVSAIQYPCTTTPGHPALNELWLPKAVNDNGRNFWQFLTGQPATAWQLPHAAHVLTWTPDGLAVKPEDTVTHQDQDFSFGVAPGTYTMASTGDQGSAGQVLAEPKLGSPSGTDLTLQGGAGLGMQKWRLQDAADGSFTVTNQASGLCMDLTGGSTSPGTVVNQQTCDTSRPTQRWQVSADGAGLIVSPAGNPDQVLSRQAKTSVVINDDQFTGQRWRLRNDRIAVTVGGTYALTSAGFPGTALTPTANNIIAGKPVDEAAAQHWFVQDAQDGLVKLVNSSTKQCLSQYLVNGNTEHPQVVQASCNPLTIEYLPTWKLRTNPDGTQTLAQPAGPNFVITQATDGSITLAADVDAPGQHWLPTAAQTTFQLGLQRSSTSIAEGASGFAVMAFDETLRPVTGDLTVGGTVMDLPTMPAAFVTNGQGADMAGHGAQDLWFVLRGLAQRPGTTVLLQSIGHPKPVSDRWNGIAEGVTGLGGDGSQVLQLDGSGGYVLAGCSGCDRQPQFNESLRRQVASSVVGARLTGVLTRDASSSWQANGGTSANLDSTFGDLAAIRSNPWPYDDGAAGTAALSYIEGKLGVPDNSTCSAGRALGPVRRDYCPAQGNTDESLWQDRRTTLRSLEFPAGQANYSKDVFDAVVAQLDEEFRDLSTVGSMMNGVNDAYDLASSAQGRATVIADTIRTSLPTPNNHEVAGGVLALFQEALSLAINLAPLLAADQHSQVGSGEGFNPVEAVESLLGIAGAGLELSGDNDDGAAIVSEKLTADANSYAAALDAQLGQVRTNLSVTESVIVSDPVKLALTADNVNQLWNLGDGGAARLRTNLADGAARDLWTKLLPTGFELWQFPPIPNGLKVTDIATIDDRHTSSVNNMLYAKGAPQTSFSVTSLDSNGARSFYTIQAVTPVNTRAIQNNVNRAIPANILDRLTHAPGADGPKTPNAGYAVAELPYEMDLERFTPAIWPKLSDGNYGLQLYNSTTHHIYPFCDATQPFSSCPQR